MCAEGRARAPRCAARSAVREDGPRPGASQRHRLAIVTPHRAYYRLDMRANELADALAALGALLQDRGLAFDVAVVGGGALLLRGLIARPTKDLDVVALIDDGVWISASPLPAELLRAAREVASALDLAEDWFNAGPTALLDFGLPPGVRRACTDALVRQPERPSRRARGSDRVQGLRRGGPVAPPRQAPAGSGRPPSHSGRAAPSRGMVPDPRPVARLPRGASRAAPARARSGG